ncbi:hypothetical protein BJX63DRAFT_393167 [Aspergillus granulosus]|uniref:Uncharacterized protein n=1 Tax=Aspergillus granulosus TaxID=176169 RepID=A0ABR4HFC9_9EURO
MAVPSSKPSSKMTTRSYTNTSLRSHLTLSLIANCPITRTNFPGSFRSQLGDSS